jgi:hypothetical protein
MSQDDLKNRASELLEQAGIRIDGDALDRPARA